MIGGPVPDTRIVRSQSTGLRSGEELDTFGADADSTRILGPLDVLRHVRDLLFADPGFEPAEPRVVVVHA